MINEAIKLLQELIAIPAVSREEDAKATALEQYIAAQGLSYTRIKNNILCHPQHLDTAKPTVLLNAHLDTVKPVANWTRDPFTPSIEDNRIYGLGSNDCGGGLVCLLMTYIRLLQTPQPYNLLYLASAEEEVSGKNGVELALTQLPVKPSFAIVGEPTGMQPAVAERGLMVLDCTAHGVSGHAARDEGVNAIYEAMKDIEHLKELATSLKSSPMLGGVKMSVTQIAAGTQHNVVPNTCTFVIDVRSNELYTNEKLYKKIKSALSADIKARSFRLSSSSISSEHPIVKRAVELELTPFGSPTLSDQALMPFPSIKIGPGDSSRSHTADEYITVSELEAALSLYPQLLTLNL